ncbi:MAG: isoflavone reductase, partial [Aeromonas sp.]|nr:isoflavone reductase [Aeromonas sp.]
TPLQLEWAPWRDLMAAGVAPWQSYPTLLPNELPEYAGYGTISAEAAIVHGLNFRPLEETVDDLVVWLASNPLGPLPGMTHDEEQALRRRVEVSLSSNAY